MTEVLPYPPFQGELVTIEMLNTVIAASSQVGDLVRAFETFEAAAGLQLVPNTDTFNAIMEGCVNYGQSASIPKVGRGSRLVCFRV